MTVRQRKRRGPGLHGWAQSQGWQTQTSTWRQAAVSEGQQEGGLSLRPYFSRTGLRRSRGHGLVGELWEASGGERRDAPHGSAQGPGPPRAGSAMALCPRLLFQSPSVHLLRDASLRSALSSDSREVVSQACWRLCVKWAPRTHENKPHSPRWPPGPPCTPLMCLFIRFVRPFRKPRDDTVLGSQ